MTAMAKNARMEMFLNAHARMEMFLNAPEEVVVSGDMETFLNAPEDPVLVNKQLNKPTKYGLCLSESDNEEMTEHKDEVPETFLNAPEEVVVSGDMETFLNAPEDPVLVNKKLNKPTKYGLCLSESDNEEMTEHKDEVPVQLDVHVEKQLNMPTKFGLNLSDFFVVAHKDEVPVQMEEDMDNEDPKDNDQNSDVDYEEMGQVWPPIDHDWDSQKSKWIYKMNK
jgi:hypothetical protein